MERLIGIGEGMRRDPFEAGRYATEKACFQLEEEPSLLIVFASIKLHLADVIAGIRSANKKTPLIGCSSPKEIAPSGISEGSVVVVAILSDQVVKVAKGEGFSKSARDTGISLAEAVIEKDVPTGNMLILADGVSGNGTEMVKAIYSKTGPGVKVVGGAAGDDMKFEKTFQLIQDQVITDAVVGALIPEGSLRLGIGVRHGFTPDGDPMVVTRSEGNVIYELDGEPACSVYLEHFGLSDKDFSVLREIQETHTHPLGSPQMHGEYLIRHFVDANPDGSIICSAELPHDAVVRVMSSTRESLIDAAREAAEIAHNNIDREKPSAVILFDCVSRLWVLKEEAEREIEVVKGVFGEDVPIAGFYTFGEIGPPDGGPPLCHNKTIIVCAICYGRRA
jgi:hypothetical protein